MVRRMETFEGTVSVNPGGGAWVEVPGEVIDALGGGGRIPVQATFDGIAYRGSIASMGGCMALGILKSIRTELGKEAGDPVTVTVERDTAERTIEVPADLAAALDGAGLRAAFDKLSYSHRREHVNAINDAKNPETRARRISKALEMLTSS
ncbi:bacteriocin resistance YdeI/OmpD-like protein [Kribbella antiqua]|uniref:Bacteriocin resistance YdeI/OmpD-like protein n=2 Tax=Kribbella antiqua TaxID=2512217 RepID=A0A4R2IPG9_9ACTN|nr:bacteriocin resistance YdeI/OmpD-like protein [Kribbella antiqua]